MRALDLFSAAAGGWTLGLHRAGFVTVAACEIVPWRRILYAENNPHGRRAAAAGLIVEAFGDAVLPQIPEAIGRAILRTEAALAAAMGRGFHYRGDHP